MEFYRIFLFVSVLFSSSLCSAAQIDFREDIWSPANNQESFDLTFTAGELDGITLGLDADPGKAKLWQDGDDGLREVQSLSIGYTDVEAQPSELPVRKELWKLLLMGALVVLVLEWYIYNRKVYI